MAQPKHLYKEVGETIRALRKDKGMTQEELAHLVKVQPAAICLYEAGLRKPELSKLRSLAEALGTTVIFLLGGVVDSSDIHLALRSEKLTPKEIVQVKGYIDLIKKARENG